MNAGPLASVRLLFALCACFWSGFSAAADAVDGASAAAVKAAYLYRMCSYVVWQPTARPSEDPLLIGTLAAPDVHEELRLLVLSRTVEGRRIVLRVLQVDEPLDALNLLFIGGAAQVSAARWQQITRTRGLLVVTDKPGGLALGGAINFISDGGRIRFEAAPATAERNGLKLSSRLLRVAERVVDPAP
jgi:hypothetical protein